MTTITLPGPVDAYSASPIQKCRSEKAKGEMEKPKSIRPIFDLTKTSSRVGTMTTGWQSWTFSWPNQIGRW